MGILNLTPDSFYAPSRKEDEAAVRQRARQIVEEGGSIIDIGACSTRPGSTPVSQEEETERLRRGLKAVRDEVPDAVLSVDTFRADVAQMCVKEFGVAIVNDVSGGEADSAMFPTVARLGVPYVLTFPRSEKPHLFFAEKVQQLRDMGANDIILDPGFGFGKTLEQNYEIMNDLEKLLVMELPLLVGISRKSMIYRAFDCTPKEALNGTTALNTIALMKGASILRVHDVKEAMECVSIVGQLNCKL